VRDVPIAVVFLALWLTTGSIAALVSSAMDYSNQHVYQRLHDYGVQTRATVTRTDPADHNGVEYTFTVGGRRYTGGWFSDPPNPPAGELSVGGPVIIVYDSRDPSISCACDPADSVKANDWWRRLLGGLFLSSVVSVVITVSVHRQRQVDPAHW
jgi:hypothetical protein